MRPKTLAIAGGSVLLVGAVGYAALNGWVRSQLPGLLDRQLSHLLNRPVDVGDVTQLSLGGIQFDNIRIPTTADNDNRINVERLRVRYDLLPLLSGQLPLKIVLVEPTVYAAQADDGVWLSLDLNLPEGEGDGELPVDLPANLRLEDGRVSLLPLGADEPFTVEFDGTAQLRNRLNTARYDLDLDVPTGELNLSGETQLDTLESRLDTQIQNVGFEQFLKFLPEDVGDRLEIERGSLDANLNIELPPQQNLPEDDESSSGSSSRSQTPRAQLVALELNPDRLPRVRGTVSLDDLTVNLDELSQPLTARGLLRFQGDRLLVENVAAETGDLAVRAEGSADIQGGYDLSLNIPTLDLARLNDLFAEPVLDLPVPLSGRLQLDSQLLGRIEAPRATVSLSNTSPITVAETPLRELRANLSADLNRVTLNGFRLSPAAGGRVVAQGEARIESLVEALLPEDLYAELEAEVQEGFDRAIEEEDEEALREGLEGLGADLDRNPEFNLDLDGAVEDGDFANLPFRFDLRADLPIDALLAPYNVLPPDVSVGALNARLDAGGTVADPTAEIAWDTPDTIAPAIGLVTTEGLARFRDRQLELDRAQVRAGGGVLTASGRADLEAQTWTLDANSTPIDLSPFLDLPARLTDLNANIAGRLDDLTPEGISLNADLGVTVADGSARVRADAQSGNLNLLATASGLSAAAIDLELPVPARLLDGRVAATANLNDLIAAASTQDDSVPERFAISRIVVNADATLAVADGTVRAIADVRDGSVAARADVSALSVSPYLPELPLPVSLRGATARVNTTLAALLEAAQTQRPDGILLNADASLGVANGVAEVTATLQDGAIASQLDARNIALSPYFPEIPVYLGLTNASANASLNVDRAIAAAQSGDFSQLSPSLNADAQLAANDGSVDARVTTQGDRWQVLADAGLPVTDDLIRRLAGADLVTSPRFPAPLTAAVDLSGDLAPLLQLGRVPIPVQVNRLNANLGREFLNTQGTLQLSDLTTSPDLAADLDLTANYDSARLPLTLLIADVTVGEALKRPEAVNVDGSVAFQGQFRGRNLISDPIGDGNLDLIGDVRLENFAVEDVRFDPLMVGDVAVRTGETVAIALNGPEDRIAARLDPCTRGSACLIPYLPAAFEIRQDPFSEEPLLARGDREGDLLDVRLQNFELSLLNIVPGQPLGVEGNVNGEVTAALTANLFNLETQGTVQVVQPGLGYIRAQAIAAGFGYDGDRAYIDEGFLQLGDSRFVLDAETQVDLLGLVRGNVSPRDLEAAPVTARLTVEEGEVGDLLSTVAWYEIEDIVERGIASPSVDADDLNPSPVGVPDRPILEQLLVFEKLSSLVEEQAQTLRQPAPPRLADVRGTYDANVTVDGTLANPEVVAELSAENWVWQPQPAFAAVNSTLGFFIEDSPGVPIDRIDLAADYRNETLTVERAELEVDGATVTAAGLLSPTQAAGTVELTDLAVSTIGRFVALPLNLDGAIDARAELGGSLLEPRLDGAVALRSPLLNGRSLEDFAGEFAYADDRFNFNALAPDWVVLNASVPYPFTEDNRIARVEANIGTPAFELVEALSNGQVVWLDGEGAIALDTEVDLVAATSGSLAAIREALVAEGVVRFENARVEAVALPQAVAQIDGQVLLNPERINVEGLVAKVAEGQFAIAGVLPVLQPDPDLENPLTLTVDNGNLDLEGLYEGLLDGSVVVTGTALTPVVGGELALSEGRVSVPSGDLVSSAVPVSASWGVAMEEESGPPPVIPILDEFRVVLGDDLRVSNPLPSFNFEVEGDVTVSGAVDGDFANLRPDGTISVEDGQIDLFSNLFFIAPGRPQTVTFTPERGLLNPVLDLQVSTLIYEERRNPLVERDRNSNEVPDTTILPTRQSRQILVNIAINATADELLEAILASRESELNLTGSNRRNSPLLETVQLSSIPDRSERELVSLLGGQVLTTIDEVAKLRGTEVFEFALMRFVVEPTLTEILLDVDRTANHIGRSLGLDRLSVFPPGQIEAIYELSDDELLGLTYDYGLNGLLLQGAGAGASVNGFNSIELRYELRF